MDSNYWLVFLFARFENIDYGDRVEREIRALSYAGKNRRKRERT